MAVTGAASGAARLSVTALRLGQFRSYGSAALETGGQTVALHGPNGAGKTNLLEAVSLLTPGRGLRRAALEALARRPARAWRVRADIDGAEGPAELVTGAEDGRRTVEIDGKAAPQARLGEIMRMVWLTPAMDRLWTEGAGERRRFLDRVTLGFAPGHGEAALAYEKAMRERNRLLREGPADPAWLDGLEAQMARAGARIARARAETVAALEAAQAGAETAFPAADLALDGTLEGAFAEALAGGAAGDALHALEIGEAAEFATRLARGRPADAAAGRTLAGPHLSDLDAVYAAKGMPAAACSTGEQKALLISLVLASARAMAAGGATPVLLLDEVAAHLDASRRASLYAEIAALGAQAWMTGTGPELFEALAPEALRVGVSEGEDGTRLAPG